MSATEKFRPSKQPKQQFKASRQDFCQTPQHAGVAIADVLRLAPIKLVIEPCAGEGYLARTLYNEGFDVLAFELRPQSHSVFKPTYFGYDFLRTGEDILKVIDDTELYEPEEIAIVTNPPYSNGMCNKFHGYLERLGYPYALLMKHEYGVTQKAIEIQDTRNSYLGELRFKSRLNFKMPNAGWTGKENGSKSSAYFPTTWFFSGLKPPYVDNDVWYSNRTPEKTSEEIVVQTNRLSHIDWHEIL